MPPSGVRKSPSAASSISADASGNLVEVPLSAAQLGFPDLKRIYQGVDLFLERPFDGKWEARVDYTFSKLEGNNEGQVKSEFGQTNISKTQDWDAAALMQRYGEFIARTAGTYIPGVDMGTTVADMQSIRDAGAQAFCADVDPGPYTATGVYASMRAAVRHALGRDMAGVRVVVQGAGHVGAALAGYAARDGAAVLVADVDGDRAAEVAREVGGQVIAPEEVLTADADVFAPCAVARVLTAENVDALRARIVCGAANDTLDTPEVAALLAARAITYVPDFIANGGGVIQVHAGEVGWSEGEMMARLEGIGDLVARVLADADAHGRTPVESALLIAEERLSAGRAGGDER